MANPLVNGSEVIRNPQVNLLKGAGGYMQPSEKYIAVYQRVSAIP
jgi:hypothetical protein